jgi:hypothetical protein
MWVTAAIRIQLIKETMSQAYYHDVKSFLQKRKIDRSH